MGSWDTFSNMKDRVKDELADYTDKFFSPTEVGNAINIGQWELYKIIHAMNVGGFFNSTPTPIVLTSSTNYYSIGKVFGAIDEIIPTNSEDRFKRFEWKSRHDPDFKELLSYPTTELFGEPDVFLYDVIKTDSIVVVPRPAVSLSVDVFTIDEPAEMAADADVPTIQKTFRPWVCEFAVRMLKGKEEMGAYVSHDQLVAFLTTNVLAYLGKRKLANPGRVSEFGL